MNKNLELYMMLDVLDKVGDIKRFLNDMDVYLSSAENTLNKRIKKDNVLTGEEVKNLNNLMSECVELNEIVSVRLAACQLINAIN